MLPTLNKAECSPQDSKVVMWVINIGFVIMVAANIQIKLRKAESSAIKHGYTMQYYLQVRFYQVNSISYIICSSCVIYQYKNCPNSQVIAYNSPYEILETRAMNVSCLDNQTRNNAMEHHPVFSYPGQECDADMHCRQVTC